MLCNRVGSNLPHETSDHNTFNCLRSVIFLKMKRRVTLKDVAEAANVSATTVSLALRNDIRLSEETTVRVQKLAKKLGYRPDPWLSSLSAYRRNDQYVAKHLVLGLLSNWEAKSAWKKRDTFRLYYEGAKRQSEKLGYRLEEFWLPENGGARRTADILFNRGIAGVLVFPLPKQSDTLEFDFSRFSTVQIGRSMHNPPTYSVCHNHFKAVVTATEEVFSLGYRRVGLAQAMVDDEIQLSRWAGAFLGRQKHYVSAIGKIPIYYPSKLERDGFLSWVKKHRCDVVISSDMIIYDWLLSAGYRVPEDIGFVNLALDFEESISGIHLKSEETGAQAVNLLNIYMTSGQKGVPDIPATLVIEGGWHAGETLRPQ